MFWKKNPFVLYEGVCDFLGGFSAWGGVGGMGEWGVGWDGMVRGGFGARSKGVGWLVCWVGDIAGPFW